MSIKKYKLTLTTASNLHIGSGEVITSLDYYLDEENYFYFIHEDRLIEELVKKNLEKDYISRILQKTTNQSRDIQKILSDIGIYNVKSYCRYGIEGFLDDTNSNIRRKYRPIQRFLRHPEGGVYIPGSSIKGFLSNVLGIDTKDEQSGKLGKYIQIADSAEISNDDLCITSVSYYKELKDPQKSVLPNDGQSNYIECIRPDVRISFMISIDTTYITIDKIVSRIRTMNENYYNAYLSRFFGNTDTIQFDNQIDTFKALSFDVFHLGKNTNFLWKTKYLHRPKLNHQSLFNDILQANNNRLQFPGKIAQRCQLEAQNKTLFPLCLKTSLCEDGLYRENGICSYQIEEIL